jgi:hypothetical protein
VVLTPRRWRQVGGRKSADDGGKQARSPRRARRKPLKPLRGECRAFSGVTVVTNARAYYHYTRGCGRIGRPAFPAPSDRRGRDVPAKTRAKHAARSRSRVCERSCLNSWLSSPHAVIPGQPAGLSPESITTIGSMGSGLARSLSSGRALRGPGGAPRNDSGEIPRAFPQEDRGFEIFYHSKQKRRHRWLRSFFAISPSLTPAVPPHARAGYRRGRSPR